MIVSQSFVIVLSNVTTEPKESILNEELIYREAGRRGMIRLAATFGDGRPLPMLTRWNRSLRDGRTR